MNSLHRLVILIFVLLFSYQLKADSDGVVAFGDDFVAYTNFSSTGEGQQLNIIAINDDGSFTEATSTPLPVSYSEIVIKDNYIFVKWYRTLLVYELVDLSELNLIFTTDVSSSEGRVIGNQTQHKYSLFVDGDNALVLRGEIGASLINTTKPVSEWTTEATRIKELNLSDRRKNDYGDWVPRYGTCLPKKERLVCLTYAKSTDGEEDGHITYTDKLLTSKTRDGITKSFIALHTNYVTIH